MGEGICQMGAPVLICEQLAVDVAQQDVDASEVNAAHLAFPQLVEGSGVPPDRRRCVSRARL